MNNFHPAYFNTRFYAEIGSANLPRDGIILSAHATTGQVWTTERNRRADWELEKVLRTFQDKCLWRLVGYSPDDQHAEPSWLIELDCPTACEIGVRFEQDALYLIDQGDLYVVRCIAPEDRTFVGRFEQRIDWLEPESLREQLERCWPLGLGL